MPSPPVVALGIAVLALYTAPVLHWLTRGSSVRRAGLDGLVLALVAGLALLHLGPHAIHHGGLLAGLGIATGAAVPGLLHRGGRQGWWLGSAIVLLGAHALFDGAALALIDSDLGFAVGAAVVVHRLPVGLAIVAAGRLRQAVLVLTGLAILTVVGFALASGLAGMLPAGVHGFTEGLIAGGLLHVVFAHRLEAEPAHDEPAPVITGPIETQGLTFSVAAASPAVLAPAASTCSHGCSHDHGHHHDPPHHGHAHHHHHGPGTPEDRRASAIGVVIGVALLGGLAAMAGDAHALEPLHASVRAFITLGITSAPALLAGFVLAGLVSAFLDPARSSWLSGGGPTSQALRGVTFGLPLPVCSCGVVPMYQSLVQNGVPIAAAMAFLVATPELGIDAIFLSVPLLGVPMTIARVVAAFLVAVAVAVVVGGRSAPSVAPTPQEASPPERPFGEQLRDGLHYGLVELVDHTLPWVLVGLVLAALAEPLLDHDLLSMLPSVVQVPLAALIGIPLYVCASGATPLAAVAVHKGMSAGAALAFLLAGPATNVTTFGILSSLHSRTIAVRFGLALTVSAVLVGWSVDLLGVQVPEMAHPDVLHPHGLDELGLAAGLAITALTIASLWRQGARGMAEQVLNPIHTH